jgi:hypothetical protein
VPSRYFLNFHKKGVTMTTLRVKKTKHYFAASNEPFNDERLSWEARGLLAYLLSKPDDWTIRLADLLRRDPAGEYKIRRMLKELREHGYLIRVRIQTEQGTYLWESYVFESPSLNQYPSTEMIFIRQKPSENQTSSRLSTSGLSTGGLSTSGSPTSGPSTGGSPTRGKLPDILSTDLQSTDSPITDGKNTQKELARRERLRTPGTPDASPGKGEDSHKRKREPSLGHPSLAGFKRMTGFHVRRSWRENVIAEVGEDPERVKRWVNLVKSWVGRGFNPNNVAGMLDAFKKGGLPAHGPKEKKAPEEINYSQLWPEEERRARELGLDE